MLLLSYYEDSQDFWSDYAVVLYRYERLLEALIRSTRRHRDVAEYANEVASWGALRIALDPQPVPYRGSPGRDVATRVSKSRHLHRYVEELEHLTTGWGLRCSWAPMWIHTSLLEWIQLIAPREYIEQNWGKLAPGPRQAIRQMLTDAYPAEKDLRGRFRKAIHNNTLPEGRFSLTFRAHSDPGSLLFRESLLEKRWRRLGGLRLRNVQGTDFLNEPDSMITIELRYEPWPQDNWGKVRTELLRLAREQRDNIRASYRAAGFEPWDREPQMREHIRWLFQRICPQDDHRYPTPWRVIAADARVAITTVTRVVKDLAKEMEIVLPIARSGRPATPSE